MILFFVAVGIYIHVERPSQIPSIIEWVGLPGTLIAIFCIAGVHSDYFILASILANIGIYLVIPWLGFRLFRRVLG